MYIDKRRTQGLLKHWLITFYEGKDVRCKKILLWRQEFIKTCMESPVQSPLWWLFSSIMRMWGLVSQGIFQNTVAPSSPSDSQCLWHHVLSAISYVFMTQVVFEAMLATIDSGKLCISSRIWGQPNILNITKKKFLSQLNSVIDLRGFPGGKVVKNPPTNTGDASSILGLGRSPGEGNGNALQYSCLGNPLDRGA